MQRRILSRLRRSVSLSVAASVLALAAGCTGIAPQRPASGTPDILLLGERHDAPGQIALVTAELQGLAAQGRLAAFALEMAPAGAGTALLPPTATAREVRTALAWNDKAWPWERYEPAVMAAVKAGVPVLGANLPREQIATAMADVSLDAQLEPAARRRMAEVLREGHCGLMPEHRIESMVRIQIARDRSMAHVVAGAAVPGRVVLLLAGAGHGDTRLGVPQHLPTELAVRSVALVAAGDSPRGQFDERRATPAVRIADPCAALALNLTGATSVR